MNPTQLKTALTRLSIEFGDHTDEIGLAVRVAVQLAHEALELREQRRAVETMAANLAAARAQGRREGLEEAARIADGHVDHVGFEHDSQRDTCVEYIAADIRARIAQEPTV